ncbi:hypothetical protein CK203_039333 [Vitis vinifera]|uniref:Reverse transcriptase zinc-binding domain-containing protein n=1 Tax=Vitis vinifera TaxID=29760 RepID=A0A438HGK5_VITVI|nr:hypothetical protein CK203_039333 [Vitis vinifera]
MGRFGREEKDPLGKLGGCCKDKKHRGLGLRCLEALNRALLGKWLWRFSLEGESLWRKIILGKFWEVEGVGLLEGITSHKNAIVVNLWEREGGRGGHWEIQVRRLFQDWELEEGNISTVDTLMRRGWSMVNICSLCKVSEESTALILIHCDKTKEFWILLLAIFGFNWVFSASVRNLILEWKLKGLEKKRSNLVIGSDLPILESGGEAGDGELQEAESEVSSRAMSM